MRRLSISQRLTLVALSVLVPATIAFGLGSWWLVSRSLVGATDSHLSTRIGSVRHYIEDMERNEPAEGLQDELHEYVELSEGDVLLEVVDGSGHMLCGPLISGWDASGIERALAQDPAGALVFADVTVRGAPFRLASVRATAGGQEFRIVSALPMGPSREALRRFAWVLAGAMPLVLITAGLGSYWMSRRALAPVDRVTSTVRAITVRDLDRRLDVPAVDDELSRLIVTFNDMLARVGRAVDDMTQFTAEAAHELRTPVSLVRTTAEVALARDRPSVDYRAALADVLAEAEQMTALVTDLLELARADAGAGPLDPASIDLGALTAAVVHDVVPAAERRAIAIDLETGRDPMVVAGDAASLRRLLLVILDNAIKYSHDAGRVVVTIHSSPDDVVVETVDRGIGLAADDHARLFDRFYRGVEARRHAADGSGLGLPIARLIVLRHRGTIELEPGPDGVGCCVRVRLPRLAPDRVAAPGAEHDRMPGEVTRAT